MGLKIAGAILLAVGVILLVVGLCLMMWAESSAAFVLVGVSVLMNVISIVLLTSKTNKKRKK